MLLFIFLVLLSSLVHSNSEVVYISETTKTNEINTVSNSGLESNCAGVIDENIKKIKDLTQNISSIVAKFGNKTIWPIEDKTKDIVVDLQEEVLCLEMEVFSISNNLDLEIDCKFKPKKLPPLHMSLLKHSNVEDINELTRTEIAKRERMLMGWYTKEITKINQGYYHMYTSKDLRNLKLELEGYKQEADCLSKYPDIKTCPYSTSQDLNPSPRTVNEILNSQSSVSPKLTVLVKSKYGKMVPFKTFDKISIRPGLGPKIKQGDLMTPEGVFDLSASTTSTRYFSSSKIDYENWSERNEYLSDLPASMSRPSEKGGAILIHGGTGASSGCLAFTNSDSAYFTAMVRNKNLQKEPLKISIYPAPLTDQFIESSNTSSEEVKVFKNFWKKLQVNYNNEVKNTDQNVMTINQIAEQHNR